MTPVSSSKEANSSCDRTSITPLVKRMIRPTPSGNIRSVIGVITESNQSLAFRTKTTVEIAKAINSTIRAKKKSNGACR